MINKLAQLAYKNAQTKGFYTTNVNTAEELALIHSEVSEALAAHKAKKYAEIDLKEHYVQLGVEEDKNWFEDNVKDTFEDELADIILRTLSLAAFKDIDIEAHILAKMGYNETRDYSQTKK